MAGGLKILYEDNHLLGVVKDAGCLVQGDRTGDVTLLSLAKDYIKQKYNKPGNVFLGLIHRLDRPTSGVVLFARTSKAASRLASEFRRRRVDKVYCAVIEGRLHSKTGTLVSHLVRTGGRSRSDSGSSPKAKEAALAYHVLSVQKGFSLVEIRPVTGRHHQIRVQLAEAGCPIVGDVKYGAKEILSRRRIALHAASLRIKHPTTNEFIVLETPPPKDFPWKRFHAAIEGRFG